MTHVAHALTAALACPNAGLEMAELGLGWGSFMQKAEGRKKASGQGAKGPWGQGAKGKK